MNKILFESESYCIQGAIFEVYRQMGCGFLEAVYQECLHREFLSRQIPFEPQKPLTLFYKGQQLEKTYVPDFVCYEKIIVELKALKCLTGEHRAQVLNYLKATGFRLAMLVNFGTHPKAIVERIVL